MLFLLLRFACIQRFSRRTFCRTFHSNTESFVRLCRLCVYLALVDVLFPAAVGVQSTAVVIEDKERACDSLLMCIVTVLSHGLRSGGGVGDVLRKPSKEVPHKGLNMSLGLWVFFIRPVADGCSGNLFGNNPYFFPIPLVQEKVIILSLL